MKKIDPPDKCACVDKAGFKCTQETCRNWIDYPEDNNCVLESVRKNGSMTLAECAKRLKISLVRVSQIENEAVKKLSKRIKI